MKEMTQALKRTGGFQPVRRGLVFTLLAIGAAMAASLPVAAQTDAAREHVVSVTGTAVTRTVPDLIVWSINTTHERTSVIAAKEKSDDQFRGILAAVKELGVATEDVQTGYATITREYNQDERGRRLDFRGFSVRRGVVVKQRDLDRFDEFFTKLAASGDMEVNFRFDSTRMEELRWETRLKAVEAAKKKASAMAEAAGARLGAVVRLAEPEPRGFRAETFSNVAFVDAGTAAPDAIEGTFAPGSLEVSVSVQAEFLLE